MTRQALMKKFFTNRIAELHNVTWPTQKQAVHSMITVLVIMGITGVLLTLLDSGLRELTLSIITR